MNNEPTYEETRENIRRIHKNIDLANEITAAGLEIMIEAGRAYVDKQHELAEKKTPKYSIGDKVRIITKEEWLDGRVWGGNPIGAGWMLYDDDGYCWGACPCLYDESLFGQEATVVGIDHYTSMAPGYELDIDSGQMYWNDGYIFPLIDQNEDGEYES